MSPIEIDIIWFDIEDLDGTAKAIGVLVGSHDVIDVPFAMRNATRVGAIDCTLISQF